MVVTVNSDNKILAQQKYHLACAWAYGMGAVERKEQYDDAFQDKEYYD